MPTKLRRRAASATRASIALTLVLAAAAVIAFGGGQALASNVGCGDTIKKDTKLDRNLLGCPNNGVVIGADGVTLNLNGHLIDGDGTEFGGCDPNAEVCDTGIVDDGHDRVTVKNGRVRQFAVGVLFGTSSRGVVRRNRVLGITSSGNRFFGFVIASTIRSLVRNSSATGSLAPDGDGLGLFAARHVRILHNSFRHNAEIGIHMDQSSHNLISGNLFTETSEFAALLITGSNRNEVRGNHSVRDRDGIIVGPGSGNVIAGNRISDPGGGRGHGDGIAVEAGHGNLVANNVVVGARVGVRLGVQPPPIGGARNVVRRNLVKGSGEDGFLVNRKDHLSLLSHNTAVGAGDDGFDVRSRSARLTGNLALRNGDLGISAVRGALDRGGNVARNNGDPRQCTNIACS
jgi:parallel beta-helix repeat protein